MLESSCLTHISMVIAPPPMLRGPVDSGTVTPS